MNFKAYAKQIPPEYQESPLYWDCYNGKTLDLSETWPGIIITGNRHFCGYKTPEFESIEEYLREAANDWNDGKPLYSGMQTIRDILEYYGLRRKDRKPWSTKARHAWRVIFEMDLDRFFEEAACAALELLTGKKYDYKTIRGCCQGDWQKCYYPANKYSEKALDALEMEYFNTGEEWTVYDGDPDETDTSSFSMYVYSWDDDEKRAEIADAAGCSPEEVFLIDVDDDERRSA